MMLAEHLKKTGEGALADAEAVDDEHVDEIRSHQQEQEAHDEEAHDELSPKAKTIDDELDELFGCAFGKPRTIPVQQVDAEAEAAAEAAARKRTIDAIMASKTFDEMCLVIASQPLPKRRQHFAQCCEQ